MKTLDMNGNPCPIPIIKAKKELEKPDADGVIVLVDNIVAVQNLQKMAHGMGHDFSYIQQNESFRVTISKQITGIATTPAGTVADGELCEPTPVRTIAESAVCEHFEPVPATLVEEGVTVLITSNQMGRGSEELGKILIKGFLFSLTELSITPKAVIFLNSGVKLVVDGINTISDLRTLSDKGSKILACGTCLNYYSLTEQLAVGEITDMFGITEYLASAARLITL